MMLAVFCLFALVVAGPLLATSDTTSDIAVRDVNQQLAQTVATLQSKVESLESQIANMRRKGRTITFFVQFTEYHHRFTHDNTVLQFDNVRANIGNGYHVETGRFVAPVAGTYAFYLNLLSDHPYDNLWQNFHIMRNEGEVALTQLWYSANLGVVLQLNAGEYVWVMKSGGPGATIYGINHSTFSGMLVSPAA